jgi:hypothetical protein
MLWQSTQVPSPLPHHFHSSRSKMAAAPKCTEKEKMLAGELYLAFDNELFEERQRAKELLHKYNQSWQVPRTRRRMHACMTLSHPTTRMQLPSPCPLPSSPTACDVLLPDGRSR